jgi:rRNA maturation endonuclease Nob1
MINKSINWDNPIYLFLKKHKCPICGSKVIPKKIKKVVNSKSIETKEHYFSCGDSFLIGGVEF